MLEITFSGGSLRCPETPAYLEVAIHLLQVLKEEVGGKGGGEASPPSGEGVGERVRWFVTHRPRIRVGPGEVVEPATVEELKAFIRGRGLTPHPRGDPSVLLWQVRRRLGLVVEAVPRGTP
jgi:hypothetical protein